MEQSEHNVWSGRREMEEEIPQGNMGGSLQRSHLYLVQNKIIIWFPDEKFSPWEDENIISFKKYFSSLRLLSSFPFYFTSFSFSSSIWLEGGRERERCCVCLFSFPFRFDDPIDFFPPPPFLLKVNFLFPIHRLLTHPDEYSGFDRMKGERRKKWSKK